MSMPYFFNHYFLILSHFEEMCHNLCQISQQSAKKEILERGGGGGRHCDPLWPGRHQSSLRLYTVKVHYSHWTQAPCGATRGMSSIRKAVNTPLVPLNWLFLPTRNIWKYVKPCRPYSIKIEWIIHSIYGVNKFYSLRSEFHPIRTPVELKFTTQRVGISACSLDIHSKISDHWHNIPGCDVSDK